MSQFIKPSGGRTFSKTCVVRGREADGRKAILVKKRENTRIAAIGSDGLTLDGSELVPTADVLDIQLVEALTTPTGGPISAVVKERGTLTIPSSVRRRYRLQAGSPVQIEERDDGFFIRPPMVAPHAIGPDLNLDVLLSGVTPENIHGEIDPGEAVGREAW